MTQPSLIEPHPEQRPATAQDSDPELTVMIRPWLDPLVDEAGHDPCSRYVERFWLGVLGPTATWVMRRLATGLADAPDGFRIDLTTLAKTMGLSYNTERSSPFSKALQRCVMFGLMHQTAEGFAVRRRVPTVAHRHLRRMPAALQHEHHAWASQSVQVDELARAHQIAMAMIDSGDDLDVVEHQLVALGVSSATASAVRDNAAQL